jgi:hypothetical protein
MEDNLLSDTAELEMKVRLVIYVDVYETKLG